jgi:hypothetical protein
VALDGGLTLAVRTVSGSFECEHPDRRDGDGRRRPLVIGDGAAQLSVRTMSGDVEVRRGRSETAGTRSPADDEASGRFGGPPAPPLPAAPAAPSAPPAPAVPTRHGAPTTPVSGGAAAPAQEPASSTERTQVAPAATPDMATLAILEALARGEIDVAEAERRLAGDPEAVVTGTVAVGDDE